MSSNNERSKVLDDNFNPDLGPVLIPGLFAFCGVSAGVAIDDSRKLCFDEDLSNKVRPTYETLTEAPYDYPSLTPPSSVYTPLGGIVGLLGGIALVYFVYTTKFKREQESNQGGME